MTFLKPYSEVTVAESIGLIGRKFGCTDRQRDNKKLVLSFNVCVH